MAGKYALHPEFSRLRLFHAPLFRFILPAANAFLRALPVSVPGDGRVSTEFVGIRTAEGAVIKTVIYSPCGVADKALPCLVYFHGGAFAFAAAPYQRSLAREYAACAGCRVFMPDYRLSPRYPYPVPFDDCVAVWRAVCGNADAFGIDISRIAVAGDSAGGCLAAALTLAMRDAGDVMPCAQMLIYPVTDARMTTQSMMKYTDTPVWDSRRAAVMWRWYLGEKSPADAPLPPYASPASALSYAGLPDAYIECAEYDCLSDEAREYAEKLRDGGCRVELNKTCGTCHGFDTVNGDVTRICVRRRTEALKRAFAMIRAADK